MGRSRISDRSARQIPWRVVPARPAARRVHTTSASIRIGPMPVWISTATRVPGGTRVGSSTASPPLPTSAVRPRRVVGARPATRVQRTRRLTTKRAWRRSSRVAAGRGLARRGVSDAPLDRLTIVTPQRLPPYHLPSGYTRPRPGRWRGQKSFRVAAGMGAPELV